MHIILNLMWGILKKFVFFGFVFAIIVSGWNYYKEKREARTFITKFSHVEGLSKGAPIISQGIEVGKVIKIFPIGNSNDIAVKGLITNDEFPSIRGGINSRLITNFKSGGGKALELINLYDSFDETVGLRKDDFMHGRKQSKRAINTPAMKVVLRIMRDTFQMSKDFANSLMVAFNSPESQKYRHQLKNSVDNTVTSIEYGTVKADLKNSIERVNDKIRDFEEKPNKEAMFERTVKNQAQALRNTLDSYANLSNTYRD